MVSKINTIGRKGEHLPVIDNTTSGASCDEKEGVERGTAGGLCNVIIDYIYGKMRSKSHKKKSV